MRRRHLRKEINHVAEPQRNLNRKLATYALVTVVLLVGVPAYLEGAER